MNVSRIIASRGLLHHGWLQGSRMTHFFQPQVAGRGRFAAGATAGQQHQWCRFYSPMTSDEEEAEKNRVASLSLVQKDQELRKIDRELALLYMKRGINTGELYTLRGKWKALARDYGIPFMVYYWTVWCCSATLVYAGIKFGGIDAIELAAKLDVYTGWTLSQHLSPDVGTIGLTIAVNEMLEPLRLPIVVLTTKPVVDAIAPRKY